MRLLHRRLIFQIYQEKIVLKFDTKMVPATDETAA